MQLSRCPGHPGICWRRDCCSRLGRHSRSPIRPSSKLQQRRGVPTRRSAGPYWASISEKRRIRFAKFRNGEPVALNDYVLTQPPQLHRAAAAERSRCAAGRQATCQDAGGRRISSGLPPSSSASCRSARRPISNSSAPMRGSRSAAGITREQAVRIYSFETGGNGTYDVQSGLTHPGPKARAISTAIGYNQLLTTNSVSLIAGHGDEFIAALQRTAPGLYRRPQDRRWRTRSPSCAA